MKRARMPTAVILIWDYIEKTSKKKVSAISQLGGEKNISNTENKRFIEADKTTVMNSWKCGVLYS